MSGTERSSQGHLMIFAKAPVPGTVKTRLAQGEHGIGFEWAARLHAACVEDVVERLGGAAHAQGRGVSIWRAGDLEHPLWARLQHAFPFLRLETQGPGDLGDRLTAAFDGLLNAGQGPVVVVGTDSPSMPADRITQAFEILEGHSCVLGPACDGGYYLLGLDAPCPKLFEQVAWGTDEVCGQTLERGRAAGLEPRLLPFWYDVDRPADLRWLRAHLPILNAEGHSPARVVETIEAMVDAGVISKGGV
ncbi:MAG: TIGR04282 family arsenosugar biosynthesis glycosyltransferase [Bradymonadia bacterium]